MENYQNLAHKFDKRMKVNFQYMAKEDSLNIYLYDDLMNEVERLKKRYHKIQMVIHFHYLIDELEYQLYQKTKTNQSNYTLSIFRK